MAAQGGMKTSDGDIWTAVMGCRVSYGYQWWGVNDNLDTSDSDGFVKDYLDNNDGPPVMPTLANPRLPDYGDVGGGTELLVREAIHKKIFFNSDNVQKEEGWSGQITKVFGNFFLMLQWPRTNFYHTKTSFPKKKNMFLRLFTITKTIKVTKANCFS